MKNQFLYLLLLLLRLKLSHLPWILLVCLASVSNIFLFSIITNWMGIGAQIVSYMTANEFAANSLLLVDKYSHPESARALMDAIIYREVIARSRVEQMLVSCETRSRCSETAFRLQYGRSYTNRHTSYIDYGTGNTLPTVRCQVSRGAELQCPFLNHLVATSLKPKLHHSGYTFGRAEFFSIKAADNKWIRQPSNTFCGKHGNFKGVIELTALFQSMLLICSGFLYFLLSTIRCIADLKKNGFLRIMFQKGLSVNAFWSAMWLITLTEALITAVLMVTSFTAHCPNFYRPNSMIAIFFVTMAQLFCIAALGFLLSVLLYSLFNIGLVLALIAIFSCVIVIINYLLSHSVGLWPKVLLLLLLGPMGHFGEFLTAHLMSSTIADSVTVYHNWVLAVSILFPALVVGATVYLDFVMASGNGYRLQCGYIFDRRFWVQESTEPITEHLEDFLTDSPNIEPIAEGQRPIVQIIQASKRFKNRAHCFCKERSKTIVALNNVSGCIYEHQITAIVGHNGSGKTTLLNILSGTDVPTEGHVSVDGLLVSNPINRIKLHKIVSVCPQENSLCNSLTVLQTLELARVSCQNLEISDEAIDKLLDATRLNFKKTVCVENLSNGMRRKLCTAVALVGDAKVLLLDEPTSGVDALSKRLIWKLLQEYKTKCSIILSTQAMDEADILADRKMFLSGGALICAGSSHFLKSAFDCGFEFNVTLKSETYAPLLVKQIVHDFRSVRVRSQFHRSLRFHLPTENIKELPLLAQALERRLNWIAAFGLHQVSLDDIFIRLKDFPPGEIEDLFRKGRIGLLGEGEGAEEDASNQLKSRRKRLQTLLSSVEKTLNPSNMQNFRALIRVNLMRLLRSKTRLISRIGIPLAMLLILIILAVIEKRQGNLKLKIRNNLTNSGDSFKGGICLFESKLGINLSASTCAQMLTGKSDNDTIHTFYALPIPMEGLREYLKQPSTIIQFRSICEGVTNLQSGCPVVYSSEWNKDLLNSDRKISVGSFQTNKDFNSSQAAFIGVGAYIKLLMYFLSGVVERENELFHIQVESTYDFRGAFISLYGIFAQILLLTIIPATFLDDIIEDKETRVKNQLSTIGMDDTNYWTTMHFVHWIQYAVIYLVSVILVVVINSSGYANSFYLAGIVLPTLIFGLSNNQLTVYILSSLLNKSNPIVAVAYFFFSVFLMLITLTVQLDNVVGVVLIALLPPFATIALTFHGTKAIFYTVSFLEVSSISTVERSARIIFFSQPHIVASLTSIIVHFVIQPLVLSIFENRFFLSNACKKLNNNDVELANFENDEGVRDEINFLDETPRSKNNLLELRHISVTFGNEAKAVQDVSFAVASGEIFGLLGPNGAGKSTTMAVIVGQIRADKGRCEIRKGDRWRSSRLATKRGHVGFCPQYNPLYANLTAREHLEFYATIMGISKEDADEQIDLLLEGLELDQHSNKAAIELSFGSKRRLSLATSLLGDPCVLVIDEASTGVDPDGRRFLWQAIKSLAGENRSIVVATHSMEEAEALATRVGILNHGYLIGLGAVQQLKNRYGQLYTLELFFATDSNQSTEALEVRKSKAITAVSSKFSNSSVIEEFMDSIEFSVPINSFGRLSHALSWLAEMKQIWNLASFSFYQMSLDETFAKMISRHNKQLTLRDSSVRETSSVGKSVDDSQSLQISIASNESKQSYA
ncbi:hypothetical protein BOX15_Mlig032278g1 [Macrostomum lignano]|uniref:ABC transporter domain-containing protein n=1 Tax=Macrostomum lignano TaxID=282301 RepID=A0A267F942_9PLAT|nr:hypothetical protein BOX15_Mlig032278g1 [Macrostomum lignano]